MDANISVSNSAVDLGLRNWRRRQIDRRIHDDRQRWSRTDERKCNGVPARIAALETRSAVIRRHGQRVVLVDTKPMVVLGMIVIVVVVDVQQRHHAGRRNQRRDEQARQGAVHTDESTRRGGAGQNAAAVEAPRELSGHPPRPHRNPARARNLRDRRSAGAGLASRTPQQLH